MNELDHMGDRIKQIRSTLKLTQHGLGKHLGLSSATLSELENNKHRLGLEYIVKLVEKFNVNLYYLLLGEGEMFSDLQTRLLNNSMIKFEIDKDLIRKFLDYFFHSSFVRFAVIGHFKKLMKSDSSYIESEVSDSIANLKRK